MQNFFCVKVDTSSMTLEELEDARKKTREMLANLEYQITLRKNGCM